MTEEKEKVYLRTRVPKDVHRAFKKASVDEGRTMEEIAAELIQEWLDERSLDYSSVTTHHDVLAATHFLSMLAHGIRPSSSDIHEVAQATNIEEELLHLLCTKVFHDTSMT
ncbi:hypothetical protein NIES37_45080 [Tolypothrix tenuis PCC 7101]|uniref:Uncharacterized protein n=1 Tax=Tolypothrix tenuis PCC 7101 TaxID=231146 RepID=A0A1Z4N481_9CYAN|nr:hypothetical protein [Tolypothrix sp. PCC 7910]MBD2238985.1 hypothetical protein [Aulosira sp. FACHB-113]QIR36851.1 hypothetical protein HCG51_08915 [Tolypothrix sp. PCC 7910]BAZ00516.1 hypothetical protein NIES37_45080 [Tolypothrix tenuis PCC 7101]BAZ75562.1 hypothetical protein NIES50_41500 [Aulosira laxa NIES-50]